MDPAAARSAHGASRAEARDGRDQFPHPTGEYPHRAGGAERVQARWRRAGPRACSEHCVPARGATRPGRRRLLFGGPGGPSPQPGAPPVGGVFQVAEKMEKRTCALCPKDIEYSVLYFAQSENIAAHENCLLYSSALVECEDHDPCNQDRNFDVESVKKEIHRGRKLRCAFCNRRGATVGCDVKACNRSYHFFCAQNDHAVLQTDGSRGIYKVFCQQHAPGSSANDLLPGNSLSAAFHPQDNQRIKRGRGVKRKRGKRPLSTGIHAQPPNAMTLNRLIKHMKDEDGRHTDATVKMDFLKKCKEAGLLNDLFEEILDKLHLIQERLMDDTASDSDYEEIGTSLFDCRLFDDVFVNFQAAIQRKIHHCEERQQQLKEELEALQDLNHIMYFTHEDRDARSSSLSVSSVSSKDYPFQNQE